MKTFVIIRFTCFFSLFITAPACYGQYSTRAATYDARVTKSYDGSYDFNRMNCTVEPSSLVGLDIYCPVHSGTVTLNPNLYGPMEDKTFKIVGCNVIMVATTTDMCNFYFALQDENNKLVRANVHSEKLKEYPAVFVSRMEQQRKDHVGKKYYVRSDIRLDEKFYNPLNGHHEAYVAEKEYLCTDFTFVRIMFGAFTKPYYILKDNEGNEIGVCPDGQVKSLNFMADINNFWDEQGYARYKVRRKKTQDSLLAAQKAEAQRQLEEQQAENEYIKQLIAKYGKKTAMMLIEGHVDLGMTMPMCRIAWGEPYHITKTKTASGITETWRYRHGSRLSFTNGKLTSISQ